MLNKYVLEDCMNQFSNFQIYYKHNNFYKNKKRLHQFRLSEDALQSIWILED